MSAELMNHIAALGLRAVSMAPSTPAFADTVASY